MFKLYFQKTKKNIELREEKKSKQNNIYLNKLK